MCIKAFLHGCTEGQCSSLVLLDKLVDICVEHAVSSPSVKAIRQALPGGSQGQTRPVLFSAHVCARLSIARQPPYMPAELP